MALTTVTFLLLLVLGVRAAYAQSATSNYGLRASITVSKSQYSLGEVVEFSAFITNTNSYSVSVWAGSQATVVSTFSIANSNGATVYKWMPNGATSPLLHNVTISPGETIQLSLPGVGENITWDQRSGTTTSPGALVQSGNYVLTVVISVAGFNPSATPCQPDGSDCDPNVDNFFTLQSSQSFSILSSRSMNTSNLASYLALILVAALTGGLIAFKLRRPPKRQLYAPDDTCGAPSRRTALVDLRR